MDLPAACMVEELRSAYPNAKFILTHRPVDNWLASMNSTIIPVMNWPSWRLLRHLDSDFVKPWYAYKQIMLKGWGGNDFGDENLRKTFLEHSALVKRVVRRKRLLVFEVKEGWGPLCAFLRKERPEGEFPNVNDKEAYVEIFRRARNWVIMRVVVRWLLMLLAPLLGVLWAWWAISREAVVARMFRWTG